MIMVFSTRYTVLNGCPTVTNTPLLSSTKIEHWPPSLHQELKAELVSGVICFPFNFYFSIVVGEK